jgi:cytochrome c2
MPLQPNWQGHESGGRMVLRAPDRILLSLGDHELNGVSNPMSVSQDPAYDLGKIVEIDLRTREARHFAVGLRNPQGLLIARDGTIWETEHGPQGGDEINVIREGVDYGWPTVTYGLDYGGPPGRDWPTNPEQGRHDGYARPIFAFVPSPGISNLVEPDLREFPRWRDHLLVSSLVARTLFLVRLEAEEQKVAYVEPIPFVGDRLRDVIVLSDGRIAMLSFELDLILLRNADRPPDRVSPDEAEFIVMADPSVEMGASQIEDASSPAERGRRVFAAQCATCHSLDGSTGPGPPLDGVMGRRIGSVSGFSYSPALANREDTWTDRALVRFLTDPGLEFEGTTMQSVDLDPRDRSALAAFLGEL